MKCPVKLHLIFLFLVFLGAAFVEASTEQRGVEEAKREALASTETDDLEGKGRFLFDYGAWLDFRYTNYTDDDNDSNAQDTLRETFEADNRFWMKVNIKPPVDADYDNEHIIYLRLKDLYIKEFPEDTTGVYDHDGPHLDYGYMILDMTRQEIIAPTILYHLKMP